VFTAYFDESGTHTNQGNDIIVVGGYLAKDTQWIEFEREWKEALAQEGVSLFHMKDFESRRGEFKESKGWTNERRIRFLQKLIGIIKRRMGSGVGIALSMSAYNEVIVGTRGELLGNPYLFCVRGCLILVNYVSDKYNRPDPVSYVIENGAGHNSKVNQAFREMYVSEEYRTHFRLGSLEFKDKRESVQCQAADLWAYEIWKASCNFLTPGITKRPMRKSMQALRKIPNTITYYTKEHLINFLATVNKGLDAGAKIPGTENAIPSQDDVSRAD
jgi:hypothetical protein